VYIDSGKKEEAVTVEQLRKVLEGYGPTREVLFSENGLGQWDIRDVSLVGEQVMLFPQQDMKEGTL
jgi:hypothetical protein